MKAIQVRYLVSTNTKPARIKATAHGVKPLTICYDDSLTINENEFIVDRCLADRQDWNGEIISGRLPNGDTAFVFTGR